MINNPMINNSLNICVNGKLTRQDLGNRGQAAKDRQTGEIQYGIPFNIESIGMRNNFLYKIGGHIGYSVRPTERRKGYNSYQLYKALEFCKEYGLDKVLVCCDETNIGSKKTILNSCGILENKVYWEDEDIYVERYWININEALNQNKNKYLKR